MLRSPMPGSISCVGFDDYTPFCGSDRDAQQALFFLGQWLHQNHGLTLQPAKTKILRKASFLKGIAKDYEQRIKGRSERLHAVWKEMQMGDYGEPAVLAPDHVQEIESLNLAGLLQEADLAGAKPLIRTAILFAWQKLGADERRHWKRMSVIADPLEKAI